jgi:hypothetical protein
LGWTLLLACSGGAIFALTYLIVFPVGFEDKMIDPSSGTNVYDVAYSSLGISLAIWFGLPSGFLTWPLYLFCLAHRPMRGIFLRVWLGVCLFILAVTPLNVNVGFGGSFTVLAIGLIVYRIGTRPFLIEGFCSDCGYDVSSHVPRDGKCPECGKEIPTQPVPQQ